MSPTRNQHRNLIYLPESALANGIRLIGNSGSGKTQLASLIDHALFQQGKANIIFDPTSSLCSTFLDRVRRYCEALRLTDAEEEQLYSRIIYCELSDSSGYIQPFSLFRRFGNEPLSAVADRVMAWILGIMPESKGAAIEGYSSIVKVLYPAIKFLAALGPQFQVTEIPDLLQNYNKPKWRALFAQAKANYPDEMDEVITFFENEFSHWPSQIRERRTNLIEVVLQPFRYNSALRATFGASQPALDYEEIVREGKTVLIDASGLKGEHQQQILQWVLLYDTIGFILWRGSGRHAPLGITIDEISVLRPETPEAQALLAQRFGEIANVRRRQYQIKPLCVIHQSLSQLDPRMVDHLAALGNQILGKAADYKSALQLAEQFFDYRSQVKRWDPIYMNIPNQGPQIVDYRPVEYRRDELIQMQAQLMMRLDKFKFLCKLTKQEGGGQGELKQLDIAPLVGPYLDELKVAELRQQLIRASGLPIRRILSEIEERKGNETPPPKRDNTAHSSEDSATMPKYDRDGYLQE